MQPLDLLKDVASRRRYLFGSFSSTPATRVDMRSHGSRERAASLARSGALMPFVPTRCSRAPELRSRRSWIQAPGFRGSAPIRAGRVWIAMTSRDFTIGMLVAFQMSPRESASRCSYIADPAVLPAPRDSRNLQRRSRTNARVACRAASASASSGRGVGLATVAAG
jgi:hypothetical protein